MPKGPRDPKEILPEIVGDYKNAFREDLKSIVLYGSAAGEEYRPGKSDINLMVVLSEEGIERLDEAFPVVQKWRKRNVAVPLFLTEDYIKTSLDAFPIEYLGFQRNHILLFGPDILEGLGFGTEHIRLQCEREIKGKLLLLRQAFLESSGKTRSLKAVMGPSIQAFVAIFRALLHLRGIAPAGDRRSIIRSTCEEFGLNSSTLEKVLDIKEERARLSESELRRLFKEYLREIRKLAKMIDRFGGEHE